VLALASKKKLKRTPTLASIAEQLLPSLFEELLKALEYKLKLFHQRLNHNGWVLALASRLEHLLGKSGSHLFWRGCSIRSN
jgi:hypothetical protein